MPLPGKKSLASLLVVAGLIVWGLINKKPAPLPVGTELLTKYSKQYSLVGQKVVDKEVGAFTSNGTKMVPALFIYLLQDRSDPQRLLVSVSQSLGYSIGQITIDGSSLSAPITITGEGKSWSSYISSEFYVPNKFYEQEVVVPKLDGGEVNVTVTYFWIWQGADVSPDHFQTRSDTTKAVFSRL